MEMMKRSVGQSIRIRLSSLVDPATPVGEVFRKPVGILLIHSTPDFAQFAVYANEHILVVEKELTRERGTACALARHVDGRGQEPDQCFALE